MKKEKLVTRTFTLTDCEVMIVNTITAEVSKVPHTFVGSLTTDTATKKAKDLLETDTVKVVNVTLLAEYEELRGMTESAFYTNSVLLPPRGEKEGEENA